MHSPAGFAQGARALAGDGTLRLAHRTTLRAEPWKDADSAYVVSAPPIDVHDVECIITVRQSSAELEYYVRAYTDTRR